MARLGAKKQLADNKAHLIGLRIALAVACVRALADPKS